MVTFADSLDEDNIGFGGKRLDSGSGLSYFGVRYYDPEIGRFISRDPIFAGRNWFVYCNNNPLIYIDPDGLDPVMLKYIAEKNGGSVSANGTVTLGGKSVTFKGTSVNGRLVIESDDFATAFGIDKSSNMVRHEVYFDNFYTEKDAVLVFGLMYYPKSIAEQQEYGATINWIGDGEGGVFYYIADVQWSFKPGNSGDSMGVINAHNEFTTAIVHTHWHPEGSLSFSNYNGQGDIPNYLSNTLNGINLNYYLINRQGNIKFTAPNVNMNGLLPITGPFDIPLSIFK